MHVLITTHILLTGFSHEHSRHDRDSYVDLTPTKYTNDCDDTNYKVLSSSGVVHYDVSYDYCSVLHYGEYTQCKITPKSWKTVSCKIKGQPVTEIGQRIGLSDKDIEEINKRYKCGNTGGGSGGGSSGGGSGGSGTNGNRCLCLFDKKLNLICFSSYKSYELIYISSLI